MPTPTSYTYQRANINSDQLTLEIRAANLGANLLSIETDSTDVSNESVIIFFDNALNTPDQSTLATLVANHSPQNSSGASTTASTGVVFYVPTGTTVTVSANTDLPVFDSTGLTVDGDFVVDGNILGV